MRAAQGGWPTALLGDAPGQSLAWERTVTPGVAEAQPATRGDEQATMEEPLPTAPRPGAAWVAPDGGFYACRWMEHDSLADRLAAALYGDPRGAWALEERGWLRLGRDGTAIRSSFREPATQGQLNVLFELLQVSEGAFRQNICDELQVARLLAERRRRA